MATYFTEQAAGCPILNPNPWFYRKLKWSYLFENRESAADRVIDEITSQFDMLCAFPLAGRRRAEVGTDYRSLAVGNYVIYYRVTDTKLEISRVLHGARDVTGIFTPEEPQA